MCFNFPRLYVNALKNIWELGEKFCWHGCMKYNIKLHSCTSFFFVGYFIKNLTTMEICRVLPLVVYKSFRSLGTVLSCYLSRSFGNSFHNTWWKWSFYEADCSFFNCFSFSNCVMENWYFWKKIIGIKCLPGSGWLNCKFWLYIFAFVISQ